MKTSKSTGPSPIGLDVGTSRIVAARRLDDGCAVESELNGFVSVPYSKITENVLRREDLPHTVQGTEIIVYGNESERFADLLNKEVRRPMTRGVLNPSEPDSLRVVREIVASLIGEAAQPGQKAFFSVPSAPLGGEENLTYHEATLRQLLSELGYEPRSIPEGLAVVYGELADANYSGIGVSFGGGLCNVCLAYLSVPVLGFSIPKAGDYIDSSAASVTGELANRVRMIKEESFRFNGHHPEKIHQVLSVYYDDMIQAVVSGLREALSASRTRPRLSRPIPMVLSGGSALPEGFRERFERVLKDSGFPVPLSDVRLASNPLEATARGALAAALADL